MIDFTNCKQLKKAYGGANGNKLSIVRNGKVYMLKFPAYAKRNPNITYTNSCVSEYLGSHIFNMLGVKAQNTILGKYYFNGKEKNVVACEDFTSDNSYTFLDFASIKNKIIDSNSNGYGTELKDVLQVIESQNVMESKILLNFFWDMFVIDAFVGNWDRHNGNWGFLYDGKKDTMTIAPVFDLGSSLFPQIDESIIATVLKSKAEMNKRVTDFPTSALLIDNKRINYYSFITEHMSKDCDAAIKRIAKRINMDEINKLIDSIEIIDNNHKAFLKQILKLRKTMIIDKALNDLKSN
ncbi:MAG: HipA domain-containing protein [Bacilli bacterium]|nr:HipA domain-containing protein [Bacilli bacterium]